MLFQEMSILLLPGMEERAVSEKVAIIVLNYKTYGDTNECLDSLVKVTYPNVDVIVVDNASGNGSLEQIEKHLVAANVSFGRVGVADVSAAAACPQRIVLFPSPENRGYSAGNNWGIRIACAREADYVMILNNDTIVEPGFLQPLVNQFAEDTATGAVGPRLVGLDGKIDRCCARGRMSFWGYCRWLRTLLRIFCPKLDVEDFFGYFYKGYAFDCPKCVNKLSGACFMLSQSAIDKVGLLDETPFLMLEEAILAEKLTNAGLNSYVVPASSIIHKGSGTISKEPSAFIQRKIKESRCYYFKNYRHWNVVQRWIVGLDFPRFGIGRKRR